MTWSIAIVLRVPDGYPGDRSITPAREPEEGDDRFSLLAWTCFCPLRWLLPVPMHSISIPSSLPREVLYEVCRAVLRPDRFKGLDTLVSLARTSRLFHGPAVSVIWKRVPNILVLISTLPQDLWLEKPPPFQDDHLSRFFRTRLVRVRLRDRAHTPIV